MTCTFSLTWGCTGGWGFGCCLHKTLQNLIITICKIAIHHLVTCQWTQYCAPCKKYTTLSLYSIDIKNKSNYKYNVQNVSINRFRKLFTVSKKFQREIGFAKLKFNYGVGWLWALDATWHDQFHGARYHTPPCTAITTRNQFQAFLLCALSTARLSMPCLKRPCLLDE